MSVYMHNYYKNYYSRYNRLNDLIKKHDELSQHDAANPEMMNDDIIVDSSVDVLDVLAFRIHGSRPHLNS